MVAALDGKQPPGIREFTFLDVLDPGSIHTDREVVFLFARHRAGVTTDALTVVNDESVFHVLLGCTTEPQSHKEDKILRKVYTRNMRTVVFALLFFAACGLVFADVAIKDGKMSADFESQPLQQVLDTLRSQTNVTFSIEEGIGSTQVSASFQDLPIAEGIKKMLEGTGVNYAVIGGPTGEPESIFIGNSSKAGVPAGARPAPYRGSVVQPVQPMQPPQPIYTQPDMVNNPDPNQQQKPMPPGWQRKMDQRNQMQNSLPPTGGGYGANPNPTTNPNMNMGNPNPNGQDVNQAPPQNQDDTSSDDEDDEDDDGE